MPTRTAHSGQSPRLSRLIFTRSFCVQTTASTFNRAAAAARKSRSAARY